MINPFCLPLNLCGLLEKSCNRLLTRATRLREPGPVRERLHNHDTAALLLICPHVYKRCAEASTCNRGLNSN